MPLRAMTVCLNPNRDKKPTRVPTEKYDLVRDAIVAAVATAPEGVPFKDLSDEVRSRLSREEIKRVGSISWHTVVVKLDLEAKGVIERVPGVRPQVLRLA